MERYKLSVASKISPIQMGTFCVVLFFKIYAHLTSVMSQIQKFLVSCETEILNFRQAKWTFKKGE